MVEQTWAWDNVDESKPFTNPGDHPQSLFTQGKMCLSASVRPQKETGRDSWVAKISEQKLTKMAHYWIIQPSGSFQKWANDSPLILILSSNTLPPLRTPITIHLICFKGLIIHKRFHALIQPGRTGRGGIEAWEKGGVQTAPHTLIQCYFFSIKRCFQHLVECAVETPQTSNPVIRDTSAIWTDAFTMRHIWRTSKHEHNTSAHSPTLVSIATASITLHHAACPWVWPTHQPVSPPRHLQDPVHSSSKPQWERIWCLLSGGSLIQLLHITRLPGRDWRAAVRAVNVRLWQESWGNVRICFGAVCGADIWWGIVQVLCLTVAAVVKLIAKCDLQGRAKTKSKQKKDIASKHE